MLRLIKNKNSAKIIKTDIKRAILSLPFMGAGIAVLIIIAMSAGGKTLFPKDIEHGLYPYYHMHLMLTALRSDVMLLALPIVCTIPYTASFLDEHNSGYIKSYLIKSSRDEYIKAKIVANGLAGGLVLVAAIFAATFIAYLIYRPMEIASPNSVSPLFDIITKAVVYFLCGFLWSSVGMLLGNLSKSKYMAYASPFVIYYMLVILSERYFRSVYVINPKDWILQMNFWPAGDWGAMLFVVLITVPVVMISAVVMRRKIDG